MSRAIAHRFLVVLLGLAFVAGLMAMPSTGKARERAASGGEHGCCKHDGHRPAGEGNDDCCHHCAACSWRAPMANVDGAVVGVVEAAETFSQIVRAPVAIVPALADGIFHPPRV